MGGQRCDHLELSIQGDSEHSNDDSIGDNINPAISDWEVMEGRWELTIMVS